VRLLSTRLKFLAELVAALMFVAMFAAFLLQVFTRYVLNDPIAWTQEFVLLAYIWITFWCGAFLLREKDHITFDMLSTALQMRARRVLGIVLTGIVGIAFLAALPANVDWIAFMAIERTPILRVRYDWLYSIFALFMIGVIVASAIRLRRLSRPGWRHELETSPAAEAEEAGAP
jgi:TRAP-type C4-dicarboxylate transport system permease small subunit